MCLFSRVYIIIMFSFSSLSFMNLQKFNFAISQALHAFLKILQSKLTGPVIPSERYQFTGKQENLRLEFICLNEQCLVQQLVFQESVILENNLT